MSEPTPAQEAYAADMALDAQIDAWYDANRKPVNEPDLSETPDPEPPEHFCPRCDRAWIASDPVFDVIAKYLGGGG